MIRGAIFDLDGTLLDSMGIWQTIGEDYLRSLGIEPRENLAETFKTFSLLQSARYYQDVYGVTLSEQEIMDGVNGMIERFYLEKVQAKPGTAAFLHNLSKRGIRMCIATATDRYLVEGALKHCGLTDFFPKIFTCTDVGHSKNTPEIFRAAKEYLGTAKSETFVFEDALHAAETAKKDGFPLVGVYDLSEERPAELKSQADIYLTDFSDFPAFWEKASR